MRSSAKRYERLATKILSLCSSLRWSDQIDNVDAWTAGLVALVREDAESADDLKQSSVLSQLVTTTVASARVFYENVDALRTELQRYLPKKSDIKRAADDDDDDDDDCDKQEG